MPAEIQTTRLQIANGLIVQAGKPMKETCTISKTMKSVRRYTDGCMTTWISSKNDDSQEQC